MWETEFIKKLYKTLKDIEDKDEGDGGTTLTASQKATEAGQQAQFLSLSTNKDNGPASLGNDSKNTRNKVNFVTSEK